MSAETQGAELVVPKVHRENAWTDLGLTLPVFVGYHLGVVFLPVRNAADLLTQSLIELADHDLWLYSGLTVTVGLTFTAVLWMLGRGQALRWQRFVGVGLEAIVYAIALRVVASSVVGGLRLGPEGGTGLFSGLVVSLGAGFYEELVFRVGIYALLGRVLSLATIVNPLPWKRVLFWLGWATFSAALFSAWHHFGELGEPFTLRAFVFRWVSGLVFTAIFALRGFAPVVWTHALYDIWVLVL